MMEIANSSEPTLSVDVEIEIPELEVALDAQGAELDVELLTEEEAISAGIRPAAYKGEPGKSPRIGEGDVWEVYDNGTGEWISTGVFARGGVSNYEELPDKPRINGNELVGDKSSSQLGLENAITNAEIEALFAQ